ncbi:hypothetical protein [Phnomibacter sp. MR]|uniref:hypothetical protein n=1 Tax=Phnomibacter sp. MR TaxID=3042318 RepID=UPI003A80364E
MKQGNDINLYHNAIGKVLSSKDRKSALHFFKNVLDYKVLCLLADNISISVKPLQISLYGNALPKSIEDLGKYDSLFKPESVENEVKWMLLSIRKYCKELSIFLVLKSEFEKSFLLGDYTKSESILESVLNETGYSLWYIEAKFLLLEYQNKSEDQKLFLSEINQSNKKGMIGTLSKFLSFRTERNLSAYKYDNDINSIFRINKSQFENDTREYYLFRLNFYENYIKSDYSAIVLFENCNSIVDRYLLLRDILKVLALNETKREFVYTKARYIYRKTKDKNLLPLIYLFNQKTVIKEYYEETYLRILDLYYSGLYDEAIAESAESLLENPSNFDLVVIHVKSHINLGKNLTSLTADPKSLLNHISKKVFDLLSSNTIRRDLIYNLYQVNKNILSFEIAPGIDYFLKKEQNYQVNRNLKLISTKHFDPYFSGLYLKDELAKEYLSNATHFFRDSISIQHRINYLNNELTDETKISKELYSIDKAKILFNQKRYIESIAEWELILNAFAHNAPIIQTALKYWFNALVLQEQFNEAINLFVENYILNPNSISKINSNELLDIFRKARYKGIKRTIDLPIFVSLNSNDDTEKSFILEQYSKIFGATKPSELFEKKLDGDENKVELFYNTVCSSETLKHSIYLNTTIELLSERLHVINHLIEQFPTRKRDYQEELNLVSNELIVYEGTQKLEESKIYANDQAIINYELNEIEGLFNRYKTIYKLSLKDKNILVITRDSFALLKFDGKEKYNETEVKYSESALLEVFHELFDSILDKYLFSKFGIVAYLSTRIRHGVLEGEIRPVLDKLNLILSRVSNTNNYEASRFWNQPQFRLNNFQKDKLHQVLSKFSQKIDSLIEEINKQKIQIKKDGKNPNGLFNYEFEKEELYQFAGELAIETDVKVFSQKAIELIWLRTDSNLSVIREYFDGELKDRFSHELNNLEIELRNEFSNAQLPLLFTNLTECSTIIENKIGKISSWFRRSGSSINDFEIKKVFDIVWSNTKKCYPKIFAECNIKLTVNPTIKSNYYIHFTDLFRIFLDNMFKYGIYNGDKKLFHFETKVEGENVVFCFTNYRVNGQLDIPLKMREGKLMIDTIKLIEEHKSGISKAIKIVKYDMGNENNFIRVVTDDPDKFIIEAAINIENLIRNETHTNS